MLIHSRAHIFPNAVGHASVIQRNISKRVQLGVMLSRAFDTSALVNRGAMKASEYVASTESVASMEGTSICFCGARCGVGRRNGERFL